MKPWTSGEIKYLSEHCTDGAESVAFALGRSMAAVKAQASRYGLSLRKAWLCPKCGLWVHKPLNTRTGWCAACSKAHRLARLQEEVRELEEEVMREKEQDRARQAVYAKKSRIKKKANRK